MNLKDKQHSSENAMNQDRMGRRLFTGLALTALSATWAGCQARDDAWNVQLGSGEAVGLSGSIALKDEPLNRLVFLTTKDARTLETTPLPIGQNVTTMVPSSDLAQLFVLSEGVFPRIEEGDEGPRLSVFDGGTKPALVKQFELDDPMQKLAIDPGGEWVAAFEGTASVTNPNELVLLSLLGDSEEPVSKTIRSFGGAPEELIFTGELSVPAGGSRRFMVVRTDRDVTLVDLKNIDRDEVTVKLPENENKVAFQPAQVVYDDGDVEDEADARFAVRLADSSDVVMFQLGAASDDERDFAVVVSIVDVGGIPTSIDFVRTDGGLRLAALVPSRSRATLIDPETTATEYVELPQGFSNMTRITQVVDDAPEGGDVALLWGGNAAQVAFWSLGSTSSTPYRSVDSSELDIRITSVLDVPAPNEHLKVLVGSGGSSFFVLDLRKRQSFPLNAIDPGFEVTISPDGERVWVTQPGGNEFSAVRLEDLHPAALYVEPAVSGLFDIERGDGGRSAIAMHRGEGWGATLLDANDPDSAKTTYFSSLQLGGLQ